MPNKLLIINPGHGNGDPGAIGPGGITEHAVALDVAALAMNYDALPRIRINQTHSLRQVVERSNALNPAIFISIHCNASWRRSAHGLQVYHRPDERSSRLARLLYEGLRDNLQNETRWSKTAPARFYVLRKSTARAAVLVELDFITHPAVADLMRTPEWLSNAADGIKLGLDYYIGAKRLPQISV